MSVSLDLSVLGSQFELVCDDPDQALLLADLWSDFIGPERGPIRHQISIGGSESDSYVDFGGGAPTPVDGFWQIADVIRDLVVRTSLEGAAGFVDLHAGVVARGASAILFIGHSTAGKTTLAIEMFRQGWSCLSDDVAPIELDSGRVRSFGAPIRVRDAVLWPELAPLWDPPAVLEAPQGAFQLPCAKLRHEEPSRSDVEVVVFLSPTLGEPSLEGVSVAEAVTMCAKYVTRLEPTTLEFLVEWVGNRNTLRLAASSGLEAANMMDSFWG